MNITKPEKKLVKQLTAVVIKQSLNKKIRIRCDFVVKYIYTYKNIQTKYCIALYLFIKIVRYVRVTIVFYIIV